MNEIDFRILGLNTGTLRWFKLKLIEHIDIL